MAGENTVSTEVAKAASVEATVIAAARASYGRLVALLAARDGDLAASEDALSEAFAAALQAWPTRGIPANPDAWLLTTARNRLINAHRHEAVKLRGIDEILRRMYAPSAAHEPIPDQRLALMFVCAHLAIQEDVRTPLMLQTILGLDAAQIASAFLISPTTMGQRLVRAKAKIKAAGIGFKIPDLDALPARLEDVLSAIYAAFGTSFDAVAGSDDQNVSLAEEAIFLARLVVALMPQEPDALGLLALMLYIDARTPARGGAEDPFIPLKQQDATLWERDKIIEAEGLLVRASKLKRLGRFQIEAAIQSIHVQAPITGATNWAALRSFHELLLTHRPSIGAYVSYAAVLQAMGQGQAALEVLFSLEAADVSQYQPYWVTLAAAHRVCGDDTATMAAMDRAIGLTENPKVRAFLLRERAAGSV
ncbi:MAG: RNA polymerase subunit sigma-70 [Alphaproteobacteria bacterium PA3]|nr:MAG: RNA polymerase subunit sigma-70 [Alphaproteobacteria bacterium PA3]